MRSLKLNEETVKIEVGGIKIDEVRNKTKQQADILVEQIRQLKTSSKLMHEKFDKTNEWHGQQNAITTRLLIFIAVCSFLITVFLGLIYSNL